MCISDCVHAQGTNKSFVKETKYSFFDPKIRNLLEDKLGTSSKLISTSQDFHYGFLSDFEEINDNYVCVSIGGYDGCVFKKNGPKPFKMQVRGAWPQMLNDTVLIAENGELWDMSSDQFLTTSVGSNKLPIRLAGENLFNSNRAFKTDIFTEHYYETQCNFLFNVLSDSLVNYSPGSSVFNNPNSNFLFFPTSASLINRYNVRDIIQISCGDFDGSVCKSLFSYSNKDQVPFAYNDSTLYFSLPVDESYKFLFLEYNTPLNVEFTKENVIPSNSDFTQRWSQGGSYNSDAVSYGIETCYFQKKYNKFDASNATWVDFKNYISTYKNLLNYTPYLIIEYDFRRNIIKSILDGNLVPFSEGCDLYIDNNNQFLIVQFSSDQFTIFNLKTKKEIITLKGKINGVNKNNELVMNAMGIRKRGEYSGYNYVGFELVKLDLNELQELSDECYVSEMDSAFALDEFTSFDDFRIKLSTEFVKENAISLFKGDTVVSQSEQSVVNTLYSNQFISAKTGGLISDYYNYINANSHEAEHVFKMKYLAYSMQNQTIEFEIEATNNDKINCISGFFETYDDYFYTSISRGDGIYKGTVRFRASLEEAKMLKDDSCFVGIRNVKEEDFKVPFFSNLFVFKCHKRFRRCFTGDQDGYDRFVSRYVRSNMDPYKFYNNCFIRTSRGDIRVYKKR
jgi:hypothetical protein